MTQEEKDLLFADLCARIPYGVKINADFVDFNQIGVLCGILNEELTISPNTGYPFERNIEYAKPYLIPLSSMTEEQEREFRGLLSEVYDFSFRMEELLEFIQTQKDIPFHYIDWLIKNNFDYRGLIPKGLAINATGLNIY